MVEGALSAFNIADGLYLRVPDNWAEFASFPREGVDGEADLGPGESEYARRPLKWHVIKDRFLRDMRTTTYRVVLGMSSYRSTNIGRPSPPALLHTVLYM